MIGGIPSGPGAEERLMLFPAAIMRLSVISISVIGVQACRGEFTVDGLIIGVEKTD